MLSTRRRASDRTARGVENAWDYNARSSAVDVHLELDGFEDRGIDRGRHHPVDAPVRRPGVGLATAQDCNKSVSLLDVRPLIDHGLNLAVVLVDRSGPGVEEGCAEAVECHVSKVAVVDLNGRKAAAVSVRGPEEVTSIGV